MLSSMVDVASFQKRDKANISFQKLVGEDYARSPIIQKYQQGKNIALSTNGLVMAVGAKSTNEELGCVFVFRRINVCDAWIQEASLTGTDYIGKSKQGYSVALSGDGDILVFGAPGDNENSGAVYVFNYNGSWLQNGEKIVAKDSAKNNLFGASVAISSNGYSLAVGSPCDNYYISTASSGTEPIGSVWIFVPGGVSWKAGRKLVGAVRSGLKSCQGTSLSLSADGSVLVVGGYNKNDVRGDVFVFRQSYDSWVEEEHEVFFTAPDFDQKQGRNVSISADGRTVAVGGYSYNHFIGCTWIFTWRKTGWTYLYSIQQGHFTNKDLCHTMRLSADGISLAIVGYSDVDQLALWIYKRVVDSWVNITTTGILSTNLRDEFGMAFSGNSASIAVGLPLESNGVGYTATFSFDSVKLSNDPITTGYNFVSQPKEGNCVSMNSAGNIICFGGFADNETRGAVWTFGYSKVEKWKPLVKKLTITTGNVQDAFGFAVSLSQMGDTMLVGCPGDGGGVGCAYLFRFILGEWIMVGNKITGNVVGKARMGYSVALAKDGLSFILGAPEDEYGAGSVLYFIISGDLVKQRGSKLNVPGLLLQGTCVALSGNGLTLATTYSKDTVKNQGSSLIYSLINGNWKRDDEMLDIEEVCVEASNKCLSLSDDGNLLFMGCIMNGEGVGSVIAYNRLGVKFVKTQTLTGLGATGTSLQGSSIFVSGDGRRLIVGGKNDTNAMGAIWIYKMVDGSWMQEMKKLVVNDAVGSSAVGGSVAMSEDGTIICFGGEYDKEAVGAVWVGAIA